jgi:hypothetical protein
MLDYVEGASAAVMAAQLLWGCVDGLRTWMKPKPPKKRRRDDDGDDGGDEDGVPLDTTLLAVPTPPPPAQPAAAAAQPSAREAAAIAATKPHDRRANPLGDADQQAWPARKTHKYKEEKYNE